MWAERKPSRKMDLLRNASRWIHLFAVIGVIVLVSGMPDNEYVGEDD